VRKKLTAFLTLAVLVLFASMAHASDVAVVKSEGVALRANNIAEVKRKAIDHALKHAVISSLDKMVEAEGLEDFDAASSGLLKDPFSYILNYRIMSEGWITHMESIPQIAEDLPEAYDAFGASPGGLELYHIWIEASVDEARLAGALASLTTSQKAPTSRITLAIVGVDDYATFRTLVASLERVSAIKDISYSSFYKGRTLLTLKAVGSGEALSERIAREVPVDFAVIPGGSRTIIIRAANTQ